MREADPGAKAIVFSQFTSMLELIQYRLEQVGGRDSTVSILPCPFCRIHTPVLYPGIIGLSFSNRTGVQGTG
jgi:hypothetical protein